MNGRQCTWPDLPARYDAALRDAVAFIFSETDPQAIIATGTIIRGTPQASSDFDIFVVHDRPYRRRLQKFFRGVPAEIFFNPAEQIRRYFANENRDGHLSAAHMLATGFVIYSAGPFAGELMSEARSWLARPLVTTDDDLVRARYVAATRLEDGADTVASDPSTSAMLLTQSVHAMSEFFFLSQRTPIPRMKDLIAAVSAADPELGRLLDAFFATASPSERLRLAHAVADRTIGVRGFFEWDSGQEEVKL